MSHASNLSHSAMERAFEALGASCEAALMAASAATHERFEPPPPVPTARDPLHATRRVAYLACQLKDALFEYCIATQLPDMDPYDGHEDEEDEDHEVLPF